MSLGEYLGAGSATTKLLLHLNGNSDDGSGNGNHGSNVGINFGKQYGKFNEGAYFNGSNSDISSNVSIDVIGGFTIIMWRYVINSASFRNLLSKCTNNQAHPFDIYVVSGSATVQFYVGNGTDQGSGMNLTLSNVVEFNKWQCWAFTVDSSKKIKGFVNGRKVNELIVLKQIADGSNPVKLGIRDDGFVRMYGYADETIIENKVWTEEEVQKYYTNAVGRFGNL
jgi:hypothetical protein